MLASGRLSRLRCTTHALLTVRLLGVGALALGLAACTPDNLVGVGLEPDGTPVVHNCGAFISGVDVLDVDSGRVVWSAKIVGADDATSGEHDVGLVELGLLPDDRWVEAVPYTPVPRPTEWSFSVDSFGRREPHRVLVSDADLEVGRVKVDGRAAVSERAFIDDVCGYAAPRWGKQIVLGVLAVLAGIGLVSGLRSRRTNDAARTASPGPSS